MKYIRKTIDILISKELEAILNEIKGDSLVANLLLKKRHRKLDLVDNPINCISISSQDKNRLSYLTTDRLETLSDTELWTSSRRYHAKPGAFISKVFKDIPAKEVEKFSNLYKSQVNKPFFTFDVIRGERIREFYHWVSYSDNNRGSLGASCMKHDVCQKMFDLYVNNNDKISMLIMSDVDGKLMGRSLLWELNNGQKVMDRIYTTNDEELQFYFKKWATNEGYYYKSEQNWFNTLQFEKLGTKKVELYLELEITNDFRYYPYMDTFKFIDLETNKLYNYLPDSGDIRTLCSSDGGKHGSDYLRFDSIDKVYRYSGESIWINYRSLYTSERNIVWSDCNDMYIIKSDSEYLDELGDYVFNQENDNLNNKERIQERLLKRSARNSDIKSENIYNRYDSLISSARSSLTIRINELTTNSTYDYGTYIMDSVQPITISEDTEEQPTEQPIEIDF
jgi:hypothetical protein